MQNYGVMGVVQTTLQVTFYFREICPISHFSGMLAECRVFTLT